MTRNHVYLEGISSHIMYMKIIYYTVMLYYIILIIFILYYIIFYYLVITKYNYYLNY